MAATDNALGSVFAGGPSVRGRDQRLPVHHLRSFESAKPHIAEISRFADEAGREVGVLTTTHVVCRETDAEALEYYRFYAEDNADADAVTFHQRKKDAHYGAVEPDVMQLRSTGNAGGTGSYPLRSERRSRSLTK